VFNKSNIFYIKEDRLNKPKEAFKVAYDLLKKNNFIKRKLLMADFGCATGEFISYLKRKIDNEIYGFDINKSFIDVAKKKVKDGKFIKLDILKKSKRFKKNFDVIFSLGTSGHFVSIEKYLTSLIFYIKSKGLIIIQGTFNNYDLDVLVKHKYSNDQSNTWQSDWNFFSKKTISKILKNNVRVKSFYFNDFKLTKTLKKKKDLIRSWSVNLNGKKCLTNGLMFIQNQYFLIIQVK
jgi:cyclopropane fatty-acyl-phospholipid synthase-like methyltransferase